MLPRPDESWRVSHVQQAHHSSAGGVNSRKRITAKTSILWVLTFLLGPSWGNGWLSSIESEWDLALLSPFGTHDILMSPGQHEI